VSLEEKKHRKFFERICLQNGYFWIKNVLQTISRSRSPKNALLWVVDAGIHVFSSFEVFCSKFSEKSPKRWFSEIEPEKTRIPASRTHKSAIFGLNDPKIVCKKVFAQKNHFSRKISFEKNFDVFFSSKLKFSMFFFFQTNQLYLRPLQYWSQLEISVAWCCMGTTNTDSCHVSLTLTLSLCLSLSVSHTLLLSLCHSLTLSLSHTLSLSYSHSVTLSLAHSLTLSYSLTLSLSHSLTRSLSYSLTFSLSHFLTLEGLDFPCPLGFVLDAHPQSVRVLLREAYWEW